MFRIIKSFVLLVLSVLVINSCCKQDEFEGIDCFEEVVGECSHLSQNEIMLFLSENTCGGSCVMRNFLEDCPHEFLINGDILDSEAWLSHYFDSPFLDSVMAAATLVHESMHSTFSSLSMPNEQSFVILDCQQSWIVPSISHFPSNQIIDHVPEENRTLRFNTYIDNNISFTTQVKGVYGLLGEFMAYYQGSLAILEIGRSTGLIDNPTKAKVYSKNSVIPYYEFKYWILTYLILAEADHNDIFTSIISNKEFKESLLAINDAYLKIVNELVEYYDPRIDNNDPLDGTFDPAIKNIVDLLETDPYLQMIENLK